MLPTGKIEIESVSYSESQEKTAIAYRQFNDIAQAWESQKTISPQTPAPSFIRALNVLAPYVVSLYELPPEWLPKLTVTGFSITKNDENGIKLTIKAWRSSKDGIPLNLNKLTRIGTLDEQTQMVSNPDAVAAVKTAIEEAEAYVRGHRAQVEIPLKGRVSRAGQTVRLENGRQRARAGKPDTPGKSIKTPTTRSPKATSGTPTRMDTRKENVSPRLLCASARTCRMRPTKTALMMTTKT